MKRPIVAALLLLVGLGGLPASGGAQALLSLELHGGLGVPTGDLGDVSGPGMALGVGIMVEAVQSVAVYGGYSLASFDCDDTIPDNCGFEQDFESSGFSLGVRGTLPLAGTFRPWASLGALFHDIQRGIAEADGDTGFEIGLGLELDLSHMISVGPVVRYRSYSVTDTASDEPDTRDIEFYTIEIAGRIHLGG